MSTLKRILLWPDLTLNRSLPTFPYKKRLRCVQKLINDKNYIDGLSKDSFHVMLTVAMIESFNLFDNKYYRQHDEVAMGSPLGPTFANIFLCVHGIFCLENYPSEFRSVI